MGELQTRDERQGGIHRFSGGRRRRGEQRHRQHLLEREVFHVSARITRADRPPNCIFALSRCASMTILPT